jgi:hypothetical protein
MESNEEERGGKGRRRKTRERSRRELGLNEGELI